MRVLAKPRPPSIVKALTPNGGRNEKAFTMLEEGEDARSKTVGMLVAGGSLAVGLSSLF